MPEVQCGPIADFSHIMIGLYVLLQMGVAKFTHHTVIVFYAIGMFVLLYMPVNRLYIFNCSRRPQCRSKLFSVIF